MLAAIRADTRIVFIAIPTIRPAPSLRMPLRLSSRACRGGHRR
jgi:hypothetical protein